MLAGNQVGLVGNQVDASPGLLTCIALVVALLAVFVFAGSEGAVSSLGEPRIRRLLEARKGPRRLLELWLREPVRVVTTLLAGATVARIAAATLTALLALGLARHAGLAAAWHDVAIVGAAATLSLIVLAVCELAPRTLARHHPELFLPLMHGVWWFHVLTRGLSGGANWLAMGLVRALGGRCDSKPTLVTEEQIEDMVRIGSEAGSIDETSGDMLQSVFDLSDLPVRALMTPRTQIDGLPVDATFEEVAELVTASNFSRYPVYDRSLDKIVGVFHAKDLTRYLLREDRGPFRLGDHVRDAWFVPETKKAIEVLKELQKKSMMMAVVVDEHGGTAGVVTMEDVLEELVGEIYDEYDQPEASLQQVGPNGWDIDAGAEIRDVADELDFDLPDAPSYSTVGGFIVDQLGRVPKQGEEMQWNDWTFLVREADDTKVVRVEIRRHAVEGALQAG